MFKFIHFVILFVSILISQQLLADSHVCDSFISTSDDEIVTVPDIPFKKGLLWEVITPEGKVNYLFGTMHSQDYAVSKYPHQVRLALVNSKTLLMESIPNEESNKIFLDSMYFNDGTQLKTLIENNFYQQLEIQAQDYGIPADKVNSLKPWAAYSLIGRPKPVRAPTLESNLFQFAQRNMIEVKPLETMEEIIGSLEAVSMDDQITILKDTICNHKKIIQSTKTLVDLYVNRDLQGIVEFNRQPHYDEAVFERFIKHILYDRNLRMLDRIEYEFKNGKAFIAVGASHLAEEKGLLNQLHLKGYKLELLY